MNPASGPPRTSPARSFLHGLLIAGGYFLVARLSFSFADFLSAGAGCASLALARLLTRGAGPTVFVT